MATFNSLLRRAEFADLFNHGRLLLPLYRWVDLHGQMKADDGMLRALAEATEPVDDSMAYLLVSHTWDAESGSD